MKKYLNSNGDPITFNGRQIKVGDIVRVWFLDLCMDVRITSTDEAESLCREAKKVELLNR